MEVKQIQQVYTEYMKRRIAPVEKEISRFSITKPKTKSNK